MKSWTSWKGTKASWSHCRSEVSRGRIVPSKPGTSRWVINKRNHNLTKEQTHARESQGRAAWTVKSCREHAGDSISKSLCRSVILFLTPLNSIRFLQWLWKENHLITSKTEKKNILNYLRTSCSLPLGDAEPGYVLIECSESDWAGKREHQLPPPPPILSYLIGKDTSQEASEITVG